MLAKLFIYLFIWLMYAQVNTPWHSGENALSLHGRLNVFFYICEDGFASPKITFTLAVVRFLGYFRPHSKAFLLGWLRTWSCPWVWMYPMSTGLQLRVKLATNRAHPQLGLTLEQVTPNRFTSLDKANCHPAYKLLIRMGRRWVGASGRKMKLQFCFVNQSLFFRLLCMALLV